MAIPSKINPSYLKQFISSSRVVLPSNCHLQKKEGGGIPKGSRSALSLLFLLILTGHQAESEGVVSALVWKAWGSMLSK